MKSISEIALNKLRVRATKNRKKIMAEILATVMTFGAHEIRRVK